MKQDTTKLFRIQVDYQSGNENLERVNQKLKEVNNESRKLAKELKSIQQKHVDGVTSEQEYTKALQTNKEATIANTHAKISLKEEKRRAVIETNKLAISESAASGSMLQIQARLIALRTRYREMSQAQRESKTEGVALQKEIEQLSNKYLKLEMSIGNTTANVGNYASALGKLPALASMIAAGLSQIGRVIDPFKQFEYTMDKVHAISGATEQQFNTLYHTAKRLGETTEYTATQVGELMVNYARLGFSAKEIIDITEATLNLATATGEDLAKSADVAGSTLRSFQMDTKAMPKVVEVMTASFNKSALSLDTFADSMKYVAPIANKAGVSLEQTTAMLGVLADRGIRGSQAGTALRRILTEMSISGKTVSEALDELNKKGLTVAGAMDEVGRYAMTALTVLADNAPGVENLTRTLEESKFAAEDTANMMRDNLKGDMDKASSAVEGLFIWLGEKLNPVMRFTVQLFTALLTPIKVVTVAAVAWLGTLKIGTSIVNLYNATKKGLTISTKASAVSLISETAAMDANTMATKRNMVAIRSNTMATKAYAAAKLLLAGNFKAAALAAKMFFASLGPIGWLALGVGVVVGALAVFSNKVKEATNASGQFALELQQEKATHYDLKKAIQDSTEGTRQRSEVIRLINERYKELLPGMITEKMNNEEIAASLDKVTVSMRENIAQKIKAAELERIESELFDAKKASLEAMFESYSRGQNLSADQTVLIKQQLAEVIQKYIQTGDRIGFMTEALKVFGYQTNVVNGIIKSASGVTHSYGIAYAKLYNIFVDLQEASDNARGSLELTNALFFAGGDQMGVLEQKYKNQTAAMLQQAKATIQWRMAMDTDNQTLERLRQEANYLDNLISTTNSLSSATESYADKLERLKTEKAELEATKGKTDANDKKELRAIQKRIDAKQAEIDLMEGKQAKHNQNSERQEQNAAQKRTEFIVAQARKLEDLQTQIYDKQLSDQEDSLNKKILLSAIAGQKELKQAKRNNADQLAEIDKNIQIIEILGGKQTSVDKQQLEELNVQRAELMVAGGQLQAVITEKNSNERLQILKKANEQELLEYMATQMAIGNMLLASNAWAIIAKKREDEHKSKVDKENESFAENQKLADKQHDLENRIIIYSMTSHKQRNKMQLAENSRFAQENYNAYKKHLETLKAQGAYISDEQMSMLSFLQAKLQETQRAEQQTSWMAKQFNMTDDEVNQIKEQAFQLANEVGNAMVQIGMEASQKKLKNETKDIESAKNKELKTLDERKRKGLVSERQAEKQKEAIELQAERRKEEAEKKAFEREKLLNLSRITMEVALGIVKIWANSPTVVQIPFAIAQTAFLGAMGITQAALILAQKYEQGGIVDMYSDGANAKSGLIRGRSHASGGNMLTIDGKPIAEVEDRETIVILKRGSERFMPILSQMNTSIGGRQFATGGVVKTNGLTIPSAAPIPSSIFVSRSTAAMSEKITMLSTDITSTLRTLDAKIEAVNSRIDRIQVHVVESEITERQNEVARIKSSVGW